LELKVKNQREGRKQTKAERAGLETVSGDFLTRISGHVLRTGPIHSYSCEEPVEEAWKRRESPGLVRPDARASPLETLVERA
jgi:hypothetical protein